MSARRAMGAEKAMAIIFLVALFFAYAGDAPPGVNEAHYLVKAKNFWDPNFCRNDLFAASGKAHLTFYVVFGWLTRVASLELTAWIGRLVGWGLIAAGLVRLGSSLGLRIPWMVMGSVVWLAGIEYGNLAGEWVIGGIEAKVPAYGLALVGLAHVVERRWARAWIWFGGAAAFHVLTGGWAVVSASVAYLIMERPWQSRNDRPRFFSTGLWVGGGLSLLGVIPAWAMSRNVTEAEGIAAARTYAYFRISHHLTPAAFHMGWYIRHGCLAVTTVAMIVWVRRAGWLRPERSDRFAAFGLGAITIGAAGLLIGCLPAVLPDLAAKLLRFYWFRLSDVVVPLVLAMATAGAGQGIWHDHLAGKSRSVWSWLPVVVIMTASVTGLAASAWKRASGGVPISVSNRLLGMESNADYARQRHTMLDWLAVCRFIRASTSPDEVLLTPRHQQTFKWYAHRAEVVNWKDVPQDAASLLQWSQRFVEVFPFRLSTMRTTIRYADLRELRRRYGVRWMIVDHRVAGRELPLVRVYPVGDQSNTTYSVYRLPE
ncbi:MAG: DUF6798 domain-containing protein [Planctomycetota bacterium]